MSVQFLVLVEKIHEGGMLVRPVWATPEGRSKVLIIKVNDSGYVAGIVFIERNAHFDVSVKAVVSNICLPRVSR